MPGSVERRAHPAHLPVHHPARSRPSPTPGVGVHHGHLRRSARGSRRCRPGRRSSSTPQWPWSVNSSRHRSLITTSASPDLGDRVADRDRRARRRGRARHCRWRPCVAGTPNSITPPRPAAGRLGHGLAHAVAGVLDDARHARDRHRFARALADEQRQHQLPRPQRRLGDQVDARPGDTRSRRGRSAGNPGGGSPQVALRRAAGALLRRLGDRLAGLEERQPALRHRSRRARRRAPGSTATRPARRRAARAPRAVLAVAGPMHAMTVDGCGLPAMPTRLRTVDDDVKTTASNRPALIASRVGAGGGAARTVR